MSRPKIEFILAAGGIDNVFDPPVLAVDCVPEWYKQQAPYMNNIKEINEKGSYNTTVKKCMPVFDAMTAGYVFCCVADIVFQKNINGGLQKAYWSVDNFVPIESHSGKQFDSMDINPSMWETEGAYKFNNPWIIRTPPGYSCLFTSLMNCSDMPVKIFSGIVDTDEHPLPINFPFLLGKNWEGTIRFGTPLVQILPFRREDWSSESTNIFDGPFVLKQMNKFNRAKRSFVEQYKLSFRKKKVWG